MIKVIIYFLNEIKFFFLELDINNLLLQINKQKNFSYKKRKTFILETQKSNNFIITSYYYLLKSIPFRFKSKYIIRIIIKITIY